MDLWIVSNSGPLYVTAAVESLFFPKRFIYLFKGTVRVREREIEKSHPLVSFRSTGLGKELASLCSAPPYGSQELRLLGASTCYLPSALAASCDGS